MTWKPSAKVIADSISPTGVRLTTLCVEMHRFVLAELNTHRVMSRNSASSRAIPYKKMREKVINSLAYPLSWPAEQKGMQGGAELDYATILECERDWHEAASSAVIIADTLHERGLHKSVINRLLEPFIPHKVILTATDWQGFLDQRVHPDAQPEIRAVAEQIQGAMANSTPTPKDFVEWHTPYIKQSDIEDILAAHWEMHFDDPRDAVLAVSAARCARVSYETHDGIRDPEKDFDLYFRLKDHRPAHASPFEHVARPLQPAFISGGNFRGWRQLRHDLGLG